MFVYLQQPRALGVLAPRVCGHEWPLGEAVPTVIIVGTSAQNHRPGNDNQSINIIIKQSNNQIIKPSNNKSYKLKSKYQQSYKQTIKQ